MLIVGAVVLAGLVLAAPASAAKPSQTEKKLQAQVATLMKQTAALQKQVKTLQTSVKTLTTIADGSLAINVCATALTADALQLTWATVNPLQPSAVLFPPESAVNDTGACQAAKVTRQTTGVPNLTAFKALLSIFQSFG
jgi:outer membrane murein-binding lipoprotein Lpp